MFDKIIIMIAHVDIVLDIIKGLKINEKDEIKVRRKFFSIYDVVEKYIERDD